ncbi:MAG: thermonuclease family protein [Thermoplasmata archaeon]
MQRSVVKNRALLIIVAVVVTASLLASLIPAPAPRSQEGLCKGTAECLEGEVTKIVDGDTLYIEGVKIRLALVDTPEFGKEGYEEATEFAASLCPVGSQATADQDDWQLEDRYGRMLAVVYCNGSNLNKELLESGHGVILTYYCGLSEFGDEPWAREYGC